MATPPRSERGTLRGRLFRAGAAAHRAATLTPQPDGSLLLDDGATPRALAPGALRWSSRIGATARRATLPDGAVFETHDNDGADAGARHGQHSAGLLHRLERIRAPLLALVLLATLAFFVGLRWTVPWLGDAASRFVPDAVETRIGAAVLETLDRLSFRDSELPAESDRPSRRSSTPWPRMPRSRTASWNCCSGAAAGWWAPMRWPCPAAASSSPMNCLRWRPRPPIWQASSLMKSLTSSTGTACAGWAASPDCPPWSC